MDLFFVFLTSVFSVAILFIMAKIMGYRQISQMCVFDYINGITIGSIAADLAMSGTEKFFESLIALLVFSTATLGLSVFTEKSIRARRLITGVPVVLLSGGKLYEQNFKKAKLDINEFLMQCRVKGYFDLSQLDTILLEPNGQLSILPLPSSRPIIPSDMQIQPPDDIIPINVIIDGRLLEKNLLSAGYDRKWLCAKLKEQKLTDTSSIFLATINSGNLSVYLKAK